MVWLASCLGELLQRLSLLSLFATALAVLAAYLLQYGLSALRQGRGKPTPVPLGDEEEKDCPLFAWLLSLPGWRSQWQKAWLAALTEEAKAREVSEAGARRRHSPSPYWSHWE